MSYGWGRQNRRLVCAGYDAAKWITIHGTLTARDWQQFKLHVWLEGDEQPWLVTHAGIHPAWLKIAEPDKYRAHIARICADAWTCLNRGEHQFLLGRGASRSDDQEVGGLNWMDWDELISIPGLNQLVGHTPAQVVRHKDSPTSRNICLDTNLRHYAVFENGHLAIRSYAALMAHRHYFESLPLPLALCSTVRFNASPDSAPYSPLRLQSRGGLYKPGAS
jgi:hypothetical protein